MLQDCLQQPPENVADGILLDLGVSSMQAGAPEFSAIMESIYPVPTFSMLAVCLRILMLLLRIDVVVCI